MTNLIVRQLLDSLDSVYRRQPWHGPSLRGSLRGVSRATAAWRPAPQRHNIWELVVHLAYWKFTVRKRLTGDRALRFPMKGHNFWRLPVDDTDAAWKRDLDILAAEQQALYETVSCFSPARLRQRPRPGRPWSCEGEIRGVIAHDVYHIGQIQLLKALAR